MAEYTNLPTVCCVLIPWNERLILVRRGLPDGYGQLALPGGFQEGAKKHTLRETAVKEVFEETGLEIEQKDLNVIEATTDELGHNLIFFIHTSGEFDNLTVDELRAKFKHDAEVLEVVIAYQAVPAAFKLHEQVIKRYFDGVYTACSI